MKNLKLLDTAAAKAADYRPLTIGYQLPQERPMLDNVLADMRRGNINHCLVKTKGGAAVWRSFRSGTSAAYTQSGHAAHLIRPAASFSPARRRTYMSRLTSAATKGKRS
jgi:hypothetical protein